MLWMAINEFPIEERFKSENLFLLGVWCHPDKQPPNAVLAPFVHQMVAFNSTQPVFVEIDGILRCVSSVVMALVTDLPARAKSTKFLQFNGEFGCPKCEQQGICIHGHYYFPFVEESLRPLRNMSEIMEWYSNFSQIVSKRSNKRPNGAHRNHWKGVKGFSVLSLLPDFDLVKDTTLEVLHQFYLGICPDLLQNLKERKGIDFKYWAEIMQGMKFPVEFTNYKMDLLSTKKWGAIEWKYFLSYIFIPLFHCGNIPREDFELWAKLVVVNWCSCASELDESDLPKLAELCDDLVKQYQHIYHQDLRVKMNFHILQHLVDDIDRFGLMWTHSA